MPLTLKIVSKQKHILGADSVRVFSVHGGSIGRATDNDWVLPDPDRYISGHHAAVDYRDGAYYLRDTSTNGVFVNRSDQPVGRGTPIRLYDGDELRMGDYVFQATVVNISGQDDGVEVEGQPGLRVRRKREDPASLSLKLLGDQADALHGAAGGSTAASDADSGQFAATVRLTDEQVETNLQVDHKKIASLRNEDSALSRFEDNLSLEMREPAELRAPEPPGAGRRDFTEAVRQLLEHAGLDPSHVPSEAEDEIIETVGKMLRVTVEGMQSLLRSRGEMKARFRMSQTGFQPVANNPLKLVSGSREALEKMFYEHSEAYLGPVEALDEAFRDLRAHQAATLKGIQVAVRELLDRLEPGALEQRFQEAAKASGSSLSGAKKERYWELYRDAYQSIAGFREDNFASVIGARFADAYDRELERSPDRPSRKR